MFKLRFEVNPWIETFLTDRYLREACCQKPQMKSLAEKEILDLLSEKKPEFFSKVYDHYSAAIFGIISKKILEAEEARQILCNVFLTFAKALKTRQNFPEGIFICLYRITETLVCEKLTKVQTPATKVKSPPSVLSKLTYKTPSPVYT